MIPRTTLAMAGVHHGVSRLHLFPGDGREAAAVLLCARGPGPRDRYAVREVIPVPHSECTVREADRVSWPGAWIETAIDRGERDDLTIVLLHSHPGNMLGFSDQDDASDREVMPAIFQAYGRVHGSAVMTPDGAVRARIYDPSMAVNDVDLVTVVGDDIDFHWRPDNPFARAKRPVAFTSAMTKELGGLTAVIIGVSGTGSVTAEQAARLGFGRVILIDFDKVEFKNLNRIVNSTVDDARLGIVKVAMMAASITEYRGDAVAVPVESSIDRREAVIAAAQGDVLFSCVDTHHGRQMADLIASAFVMPLFDMGVTIPVRTTTDGFAVADAVGRIDYVQPGASTLRSRGVWTPASVRAEYLAMNAPDQHAQEVADGYIDGAIEEAPAVISLNMRAASSAMNEFLARAYPFRLDPNHQYARTIFSLAGGDEDHFGEDDFNPGSSKLLGRGGVEPLLGIPGLGVRE